MPKLEEFATVCCKLCKYPVKMQSVKDHMGEWCRGGLIVRVCAVVSKWVVDDGVAGGAVVRKMGFP